MVLEGKQNFKFLLWDLFLFCVGRKLFNFRYGKHSQHRPTPTGESFSLFQNFEAFSQTENGMLSFGLAMAT
jgi:hypothetical protein